MTAPIWITKAGSLGIIPDEEFYQLRLQVYDINSYREVSGTLSFTAMSVNVTGVGTAFTQELSLYDTLVDVTHNVALGVVVEIIDDTHLTIYQGALNTTTTGVTARDPIRFKLISGSLPVGLHIDQFGNVMGVPINGEVEGVPAAITKVTTSTFTVRALNTAGEVADRTFSITVAGVNPPVISPKNTSLGTFFDGDLMTVQLTAVNFNQTNLSWQLTEGALPPGVTLSPSGLLQGFIEPAIPATGATQGFDASQFDRYTFDFFGVNISKNYQFKILVSDGYTIDTSAYTVFVYNKSNMTADSDKITADTDSIIDVSTDSKHTPILRNLDSTLEAVRQGGYHAYKFDGYDFDGDDITYSYTGTLPIGLSINPTTGWLTGLVPIGPLGIVNYTFTVRVSKTSYPSYYTERTYTLPIQGQINNTIIWDTPAAMGTINNGDLSTFAITAHTDSGRKLHYRILYENTVDSNFVGSRLPQGLILTDDGLITGRVSFETFRLDGGLTTYDNNQTTFDHEFKFTVEAYDSDNYASGTKEFNIIVDSYNLKPYENLYIQALPAANQRYVYDQLINNSDIFPVDDLYRFNDPWFGKNTDIRSLFLTGLNPAEVDTYVSAMSLNHYWKKITFGDIKTAQALDQDFNVKYEVVYATLVDNEVNERGQSAIANLAITSNSEGITNVYPNSFTNMSSRFTDTVGYANKSILPEWMTSRQTDGRVLGFTRALVLCYTKPGRSSAIAYRVNQRVNDLRLVDFTIDRYLWDSLLSSNYNKTSNNFTTDPETTFDRSLYTGCTGTITTSNASILVSGVNTEFSTQLVESGATTSGTLIKAEIAGSGNISIAANSNVVVGSGTVFETADILGQFVVINNNYTVNGSNVDSFVVLGTVVDVQSNTSLVLSDPVNITASNKNFLYTVDLGEVNSIASDTALSLDIVPNYTVTDSSYGAITETATTFDFGQTRFFTERVGFTNNPDLGSSYLKFPNVTITTRSLSS